MGPSLSHTRRSFHVRSLLCIARPACALYEAFAPLVQLRAGRRRGNISLPLSLSLSLPPLPTLYAHSSQHKQIEYLKKTLFNRCTFLLIQCCTT